MVLPFQQVNVFSSHPLKGNPVAVIHHADHLSDTEMQQLARWTNLSETTFLLSPHSLQADYRLRIFTPTVELPFAGHPTLGSCHAWLKAGGTPRSKHIVQECPAGLISIKRSNSLLSFAAPPLVRSGSVAPDIVKKITHGLHLSPKDIIAMEWVDNGPGWIGVLLRSRQDVLAIKPNFSALSDLCFGVIGPWNPAIDGTDADFEIRAFAMKHGVNEDPICGSLNASIAQWLIGQNKAPSHYIVTQGASTGREGRLTIERIKNTIWVGGHTHTTICGNLHLT